MDNLKSWGNYPNLPCQTVLRYSDLRKKLPYSGTCPFLPRGLGRSYGDSCLNSNGKIVEMTEEDYFIEFDALNGILTTRAGISFDQILKMIVPKAWFLPVTPGTKFITVGGAVANDIHGKNHHSAGCFGNHILSFKLLRSDGQILECSDSENRELFLATIGGLGLTGIILEVKFKLLKLSSSFIEQQISTFYSLDQFIELSDAQNGSAYTVAWVDCLAGKELRGIFFSGNHAASNERSVDNFQIHKRPKLNVPISLPEVLLNGLTIRAFNEFYFQTQKRKNSLSRIHYEPFFYPLDSIANWNRLYGRRGFLQYQFVVPRTKEGFIALNQILSLIKASRMGSFLAVLKMFGEIPSKGILSFARPGITLALDFANTGDNLLALLNRCDQILLEVGGAVYPAKDSRMGHKMFKASFPRLDEFLSFKDPQISSSFWKRVMNE